MSAAFRRAFEDLAIDVWEREFSPFRFIERTRERTEGERRLLLGLVGDQIKEDARDERQAG